MSLSFQERPAAGDPAGVLVLHHGRGSDDNDLLGLAGALDPERRLTVVTPRAPFELPGAPGFHWYIVPQVGFPEPRTFAASVAALGEFHDSLLSTYDVGPERLVLGGFSQGAVMSWALALNASRPAPAGVLALSGFIPTVEGFSPVFRQQTRAFVAHGDQDAVIPASFGQAAVERVTTAGMDTESAPFAGGHQVDPAQLPRMRKWLSETLAVTS